MKKLALLLGICSILIFTGIASANTYECDSCASCQNVINSTMSTGDTLLINQSFTADTDYCISYDGATDGFHINNTIIDCQGYTIDSPTYSVAAFIANFPLLYPIENVTLRNCNFNYTSGGNAWFYVLNNSKMQNIITTGQVSLLNDDNFIINNLTLTNNFIRNENSNNTIITNSNIQNPSNYAIYNPTIIDTQGLTINNTYIYSRYGIQATGTSPTSTLIYNNIMNITSDGDATYFSGLTGEWNTTLTSGTNIVGGSYIGGNYWAFDNGTGYSQTCIDNNLDRICDSPFSIDGSNTDYLPLSVFNTYECNTCAVCRTKIIGAREGDTVKLNTSISNFATSSCITFSGKSNIQFDCMGNTIDGTRVMFPPATTYYGILIGRWINNTLDGANSITIRNCTITDWWSGIFIDSSTNNTLTDITASNNIHAGILLFRNSNNNTLSNIIANSNQNATNNNYGIILDSVKYNNLTNITANSNIPRGILLQNSSFNNLNSITANNNSGGNATNWGVLIYLNSNNNTLTDITANSNARGGLVIQDSFNNIITNLTASSNNELGYLLFNTSQYNTLRNSHIDNNTIYGIQVDLINIGYNMFYNNLMNNTMNFFFNTSFLNYWNNTARGNYWAYPNGTGYSQTCLNQNNDSFCDTPFIMDSNNKDFIPLTNNLPLTLTINWNTPANNSFTGNNITSILWNATIGDIPNACTLNVGASNYSMLINGNYCYYTTSNLTNQTKYCGRIYANNSISNVSSSQCATIGESPTPTGRPIDNLGIFAPVALIIIGAGIILFIMEGLFGVFLISPKNLFIILIGAAVMAAMILALL